MTSTARIPDVFRLAALSLVLLAAVGLAGCSQEGKTVTNALPVQGIAYDVTAFRETTFVNDKVAPIDTFTTNVTMDVRLKVQTVYRNLCEARGGLELRQVVDGLEFIYVVTPLARYTADEDCNVGASGDTLQTITIRGLFRSETGPLTTLPSGTVFARMQVAGESAPPIDFDIRYDLATSGADSTLYDIKVEDATTGLPIDGALVSVQENGTPNIIGEGTTSGGGKFYFSVAYGGAAGDPGDPYIVTVSYAGRITKLRAIDFPSLSKRREAIVVRV